MDTFLPFGEIVDVTIPKPELPSSTDPHRGFGYIEFEIPGDAEEAIDNMDQSELFGRVIRVAAAKPQKDSNEGLGSRTAVWESVNPTSSFLYIVQILTKFSGGLSCKACRERRRSCSNRFTTRRSQNRLGGPNAWS